ncbi:GNAT family N-acetyltransferase [Chryseomicrobium excrementi]|uniref:GNAT family N-acetyltransferase n=1 Tax=Chryseomicrobium excrementi TaxID=2041346 RepID=A0A2M9EXT0_9BACL|nr:GNAT family N-acetyltransferase [Chryseomicrobium excrementi]PJK16023.1 GNAT family N-acetyltransferase [Chryseomicrobium excrementi]
MIRKLASHDRIPMELLLLADPSEFQIKKYLSDGDCYLAEFESEFIGVYILKELNAQSCELMNVAVAEAWQGKGIGKQLILHAIETAKGYGYQTVHIATGNSSIGQLALYQKCGFRMVGIEADYFTVHYPEPIFENGIQCRDKILLKLKLKGLTDHEERRTTKTSPSASK